jgi:hypothetical protein
VYGWRSPYEEEDVGKWTDWESECERIQREAIIGKRIVGFTANDWIELEGGMTLQYSDDYGWSVLGVVLPPSPEQKKVVRVVRVVEASDG